MNNKLFGAKAKVYIYFNGSLFKLGQVLSKGLQIPEFRIDTDSEPPYEPIAMTEAFGIESWLKTTKVENWNYEFEISTMHCINENASDNMHDLSEWLRRYVNDICNVKADIKK